MYGINNIKPKDIINNLGKSWADMRGLPHHFHLDFSYNVIGGGNIGWINNNNYSIFTSPTEKKSTKGHVGRIGQTSIEMARSYLT